MSKPLPLPVYDRRNARLFQEFMDDSPSTYESRPHRSLVQWITSSPTIDWLVAAYQKMSFSARKIDSFVRKHDIDMSEFESGPFENYAAFFEGDFCQESAHSLRNLTRWERLQKGVILLGRSFLQISSYL